MAKTRALVWGILAAVLLLTGAGAGWVALNQDRLARALIERLEAHLLTDAHIDHIDVDLLSHFPNVSLVLHDAWLLGSHSPTDTLLKAHELSVTERLPVIVLPPLPDHEGVVLRFCFPMDPV